ncbi:cellulose biosynthesis cyclic di-GMP-binding regulatory protein BcsB [Aureimonas sp. AU22]|uniref:cellulose biosynthesis cyclic di-GMP-binding regulatory protein BcsB n=1 Tax=Aureimonas sp. AU22 TaxID=1638162 RepID=UPI0009E78134|nr:cellulose biosynthesis cyclic di-GMP-binding regulatory protein BcsB [Aureimonas sp. AU22]
MSRRIAPALAFLAAAFCGPAGAQPAPFDMSGERPPATESRPVREAPPSSPAADVSSGEPASDAPPASVPPASPAPQANRAAIPAPGGWRRHLVAGPELALSGETDRRRWSVYLTREEAEASARLAIAYQNAILVAPEASRLRVLVNDMPLVDEPVASSDDIGDLSAPVPPGLLHPGFNTISVESTLRHRTDCTVSSTYDLWTRLNSAGTFLEFTGTPADFAARRLEDIRATGTDAEGLTHIRITLPDGQLGEAAETVLRLSQGLALLAAMPNQSVEIVQGSVPPVRSGTLDVVVAPADAVGALMGTGTSAPAGGTSFLQRTDGSSVLVVTGTGWDEVRAGAERIVSFVDPEDRAPRPAFLSPALRTPDAPLMRQGGALRFRDLGVASQEFSGRRFRTEFAVAFPGDFFARAYGEAVMRLDAAYSGEVLPGSLVNVYVNGNIATTLPIGGGGSGALNEFPLRVTMRHVRPGANTIALEANLLTAADDSCAPGTSTGGTPRFALFDTSRFEVPDFARIARVPDLSAFQGVGFPYNVAQKPVDVVLPDDRPDGLDAAADLFGRVAFSAGHVIPLRVARTPAAPASHALFIGSPRQLPPTVLSQVNIDPKRAAEWGGQTPGPAARPELTPDRWQEQFGAASGWRGRLADLGDWLRSTLDIEAGGLRLLPAQEQPFTPGDDDGLVIAQGAAADGAVWTVVTSPSTATLKDSVGLIVRESNWVQLDGRVSAFDPATGTVTSQSLGAASLLPTQPFSLANLRLIVANWLSENVLAYASLIVAVALLLGVATTAFVKTLGQRR